MAIKRATEGHLDLSSFFMSFTSLPPKSSQALPFIPGCAQKCLTSPHRCVETSKASCPSLQARLLLHFFLILLHLGSGAFGIKVQKIIVPHPGVVERPATLECVYDTQQDNFYSIRWYLNGEQFYSFIKKNNPEKINHNHTDVDVELDHSDTRKVTVREITAAAEGQYRCEVMGEAPLFETDSTTQNLSVVRLPDKPEIRVTRSSYRVGEVLEATCTARHSWPASAISFSVNGDYISAEPGRVRNMGVSKDEGHSYFPKGSYTSTSMLILPVEGRFSSSLRLGCHAHVQSLEKANFVTVEVDFGISSLFSFFNAGVACWTSDIVPTTMILAMLLLLQNRL
ncbi:uncharacterized protein [Macrobrachium rosenbergii]|uniref:uncharacterized protein n=1 Tax=Macrobrachium rosenbergii TaxID=79674 RepID=UPI0034D39DD7